MPPLWGCRRRNPSTRGRVGWAAAPRGRCCRCRVALARDALAAVPTGAGGIRSDERLRGARGVWGGLPDLGRWQRWQRWQRRGDGAQVLQSRRRALRQDGKGTRVLSTLGWGRAQMSSPCPSPHWPGFRRAPDITSAVEPASLNTRQPCRRAARVKPDATQDRQRWVWGGFRHQDQNAALHGGSSSSPLAPAIHGPSASPSRRWCLQESSWGLLLSMDLPTHFFNSNHDEESMKP